MKSFAHFSYFFDTQGNLDNYICIANFTCDDGKYNIPNKEATTSKELNSLSAGSKVQPLGRFQS